jgi:hypothetical protein
MHVQFTACESRPACAVSNTSMVGVCPASKFYTFSVASKSIARSKSNLIFISTMLHDNHSYTSGDLTLKNSIKVHDSSPIIDGCSASFPCLVGDLRADSEIFMTRKLLIDCYAIRR